MDLACRMVALPMCSLNVKNVTGPTRLCSSSLKADTLLSASFKPRAAILNRSSTLSVSAEAKAFDAIIEIGGGQQMVTAGRYYSCNSLNLEAGTEVKFERVLAVKDGDDLQIGQPYVKGASVAATVLEGYKGKKVIVYKMHAKKHYRRKNGHRQVLTKFLVTGVDV
mmetsp:Transcript_24843/g.34235  ORF Transcript_24843/g.34235 Transcript_24843/m.34235 type:complete len:166 (-) Transcript_24843:134-631(-)|eukprot:CAMPEP_0196570374 /NCGR_PEP_ID=MMETSP1081-20130531/437_1 /TAXON_ID=36882 /ORGANISM="Pyramimonas amylifera, Strain CCMP720" /LENGTH=165 /DNA_ID=CAMNT_0041886775 /DNA_START=107 /DNA_END=604 /DNA_ORIENTATION=-